MIIAKHIICTLLDKKLHKKYEEVISYRTFKCCTQTWVSNLRQCVSCFKPNPCVPTHARPPYSQLLTTMEAKATNGYISEINSLSTCMSSINSGIDLKSPSRTHEGQTRHNEMNHNGKLASAMEMNPTFGWQCEGKNY